MRRRGCAAALVLFLSWISSGVTAPPASARDTAFPVAAGDVLLQAGGAAAVLTVRVRCTSSQDDLEVALHQVAADSTVLHGYAEGSATCDGAIHDYRLAIPSTDPFAETAVQRPWRAGSALARVSLGDQRTDMPVRVVPWRPDLEEPESVHLPAQGMVVVRGAAASYTLTASCPGQGSETTGIQIGLAQLTRADVVQFQHQSVDANLRCDGRRHRVTVTLTADSGYAWRRAAGVILVSLPSGGHVVSGWRTVWLR